MTSGAGGRWQAGIRSASSGWVVIVGFLFEWLLSVGQRRWSPKIGVYQKSNLVCCASGKGNIASVDSLLILVIFLHKNFFLSPKLKRINKRGSFNGVKTIKRVIKIASQKNISIGAEKVEKVVKVSKTQDWFLWRGNYVVCCLKSKKKKYWLHKYRYFSDTPHRILMTEILSQRRLVTVTFPPMRSSKRFPTARYPFIICGS